VLRRLLVLTVVVAALAVVAPSAGLAGPPPPETDDVEVELASPVEPLTFAWGLSEKLDCDTIEVLRVDADDTSVPFSAIAGDKPNLGTVVLPSDTPPGVLTVVVECIGGEDDGIYTGDAEWAALAVTKHVDGSAPTDARFEVAVTCVRPTDDEPGGTGAESFVGAAGILDEQVFTLPYGAAGGTKYVYFDDVSDCTITEPVNGGALSTTIVPDEILVRSADPYSSVVTNTFPVAVSPTFTG